MLHRPESTPGETARALLHLRRAIGSLVGRHVLAPGLATDHMLNAEPAVIDELVAVPTLCDKDAAAKFRLLADLAEHPAGEFLIEADAIYKITKDFVAFRNSQHLKDVGCPHPRYGKAVAA